MFSRFGMADQEKLADAVKLFTNASISFLRFLTSLISSWFWPLSFSFSSPRPDSAWPPRLSSSGFRKGMEKKKIGNRGSYA
jgi:hypothetical protein